MEDSATIPGQHELDEPMAESALAVVEHQVRSAAASPGTPGFVLRANHVLSGIRDRRKKRLPVRDAPITAGPR